MTTNPHLRRALNQATRWKNRWLMRRRSAYRDVFLGDDGRAHPVAEIVLKDLAKFCFAHETTFQVDARAHALSEGRREVWLRINTMLNISEADLLAFDPVKPEDLEDDYG